MVYKIVYPWAKRWTMVDSFSAFLKTWPAEVTAAWQPCFGGSLVNWTVLPTWHSSAARVGGSLCGAVAAVQTFQVILVEGFQSIPKGHLGIILNWLVVDLPPCKIWVRQLGWWNSQYMEKKCSKPPTSKVTRTEMLLFHETSGLSRRRHVKIWEAF